jgi:hypothetical protein
MHEGEQQKKSEKSNQDMDEVYYGICGVYKGNNVCSYLLLENMLQ